LRRRLRASPQTLACRLNHVEQQRRGLGQISQARTAFDAAVAGAVSGGGLTVIANAPKPVGQSILNRHFEEGISPLGLLKAALIPTVIVGLCFASL
jgi:Na+/H+ antiporter NhaD/arsenite permease-like protein